jgi:hypothetical protein
VRVAAALDGLARSGPGRNYAAGRTGPVRGDGWEWDGQAIAIGLFWAMDKGRTTDRGGNRWLVVYSTL